MPEESRRNYDVFISYSSKDKKWADAACAVLERHRIRCWVAPRDITPGTEWGAAIIQGMDASKIMVLIFSTHANESAQVRREVERAISKGLIVLPFRVEDVSPAGAMEYALGNTHWLDGFTRPLERQFDLLAKSVKSLLGESHEAHAELPAHDAPPAALLVTSRSRTPVHLMIAGTVAVLTVVCLGAGWMIFRDKKTPAPIAAANASADPPAARVKDQPLDPPITKKQRIATEHVAKKKGARFDPDALRVEQMALTGRWHPSEAASSKVQSSSSAPAAKKKGRGAGLFGPKSVWIMRLSDQTLRITIENDGTLAFRGVVALGSNGRRRYFDFHGKRADGTPFVWYGIHEFEGEFLKVYLRLASDHEHPTPDRPDSFVVSTDNKGLFLKFKRIGDP